MIANGREAGLSLRLHGKDCCKPHCHFPMHRRCAGPEKTHSPVSGAWWRAVPNSSTGQTTPLTGKTAAAG